MAGGNRSAAAKKAWITRRLGSGGRVPRNAAGNALIPIRRRGAGGMVTVYGTSRYAKRKGY